MGDCSTHLPRLIVWLLRFSLAENGEERRLKLAANS